MILEKEGNKLYIKKHRKSKFIVSFFTIFLMFIMVILCLIIFTYDNNKNELHIGVFIFKIDFGLFNYLLQNDFGKIILTICVICIFGLYIINYLFSGNCDYYIDVIERKIYYLDGKWKFKRTIIIDFENIKNIVLIENMIIGYEGKKIYSYRIDIYDNELNAYEIYVFKDYDTANNIANKIGKIIGIEVNDWSHIENYEGFRKRIL
jgi:hypothetical protein